MKIIDFYKSILTAGSLRADAKGYISAVTEAGTAPFTVGGKRLVLPTPEHLSNPDKVDICLFHPLSENILRGESDVMTRFRTAVNLQLNYVIKNLLDQLVVLATSASEHSKLQPNNYTLISLFKESDEKTVKDFQSLIKAMPQGNINKCVVHLFMKKNANINGKSHRRGVIVTFPLYEEILKSDGTVYGVKLRKKDFATLKAVLEFLLPKIEEKDAFSRGSISDTAPTLDALLLGVLGIASHLNSVMEDYCEIIPDIKQFIYEDDWVPELDNMNQFTNELRLLPMQSGNEGIVESKVVAQVSPNIQNVAPPVQQVMQPVQQVMPSVYQPPQAAAMPAPGSNVVTTQQGLVDFSATLRMNPQYSQMGMGNMNMMPPGPMANRNGPAAFDRGYQPMQPQYGYQQQFPQQPQYPQMNMGGNIPRI